MADDERIKTIAARANPKRESARVEAAKWGGEERTRLNNSLAAEFDPERKSLLWR
ncbi:hypothetical protein DSM21852_03890 [Methylocystis bryophila]|nr:hypothetical protein DSM21852_03890 [Methylocystis bryophila]